jgi:hypothetical protein
MADMMKGSVEGGVKAVLAAPGLAKSMQPLMVARALHGKETAPNAEDVGTWKALTEDTIQNETERRLEIHRKLLADSVKPGDVSKWLYKEVLHADLDDPYLGLGKVLFADYPFAKEDNAR